VERDMQRARQGLEGLEVVREISNLVRVEDIEGE
jgi:hypothetical protein